MSESSSVWVYRLEDWRWRVLYAAHLLNIAGPILIAISLGIGVLGSVMNWIIPGKYFPGMFLVSYGILMLAIIVEWLAYLPNTKLLGDLNNKRLLAFWLVIMALRAVIVGAIFTDLSVRDFQIVSTWSLCGAVMVWMLCEQLYRSASHWDLVPRSIFQQAPMFFRKPARAQNIYPPAHEGVNAH